MSKVPETVARCAAALVLMLLLHLEVWLLFAAGVGVAALLVRRFWLHTHHWQPIRVAATALALARPPEDRPSQALVRVLTSARPRRVVVARASRLLDERGDDLDWGTAMREIVLADELVATLTDDPNRNWVPLRLAGWGLVTVLGTLLSLPIAVFVAGFAGTLIAVIDFQEQRRVQPMLLATESLQPVEAVLVAGAPAGMRLALQAGSRTIIDRAATYVDQAAVSDAERQRARVVLDDARGIAAPGPSAVDTVVRHAPEVAIAAAALVFGR